MITTKRSVAYLESFISWTVPFADKSEVVHKYSLFTPFYLT
jgi:hypothetical protein